MKRTGELSALDQVHPRRASKTVRDLNEAGGDHVKLEGTLEAFGLPAVLQLLGVTATTGALRLSQGAEQEEIFLREGQVVGLEVEELAELLGWDGGSFAFHADAQIPEGAGVDHRELIEQAQQVLAAWKAVAASLPADREILRLAESISGPVSVDPGQWALLARLDGHAQVAQVCADANDKLRLAGLIKQGMVESVRQAQPAPYESLVGFGMADSLPLTLPTQPVIGAGYEVVGSLAMKPDMLLDQDLSPGIHEVLLKRLVTAVRGL